jgi:hypothetical protein
MLSGSPNAVTIISDQNEAIRRNTAVLNSMNCTGTANSLIECAKKMSATELLTKARTYISRNTAKGYFIGPNPFFTPIVDDYFLTDFRKIVKTKRYTFPKSGPKNVNRKISNLNKLLFTYPGTLGVKTGWTTKGQNTYIGVVERDGRTIIITFMHLKYGRDALAKELFDWGFKAIGEVEPVGKLV